MISCANQSYMSICLFFGESGLQSRHACYGGMEMQTHTDLIYVDTWWIYISVVALRME